MSDLAHLSVKLLGFNPSLLDLFCIALLRGKNVKIVLKCSPTQFIEMVGYSWVIILMYWKSHILINYMLQILVLKVSHRTQISTVIKSQ